ncbi:MAG: NERD domain-containing protein/DEAD/DEAH box helicase [Pirellulales bacterium]|nr:NERD domain-containing protein/DEAD/DEAH box helicase [Pirellulales bacterium]
MARMIPSTIHPHVRSSAERRLFEVIRDAPGTEDWVCLHSLGLARHASKRRGEIDFLLLTRKGIFVLEVKGGGVAREGGIWRFTDRYGDVHSKHESPFDQASSGMFALEEDIRREYQQDERRSRLLFGFGAMFPDIVFDVTGTEADPRQVYDSRDRRRPITQFVDRLAAYCRECDMRNRYMPTPKDIEAIAAFLRGDFDLIPPLGVLVEAAAEQLLSLEREQYAVLDALEQYPKPRMLVQGGAGTGKTLLAVEAARREARKGQGDILLLCYNRFLASFLDTKIKAEHVQGCAKARCEIRVSAGVFPRDR